MKCQHCGNTFKNKSIMSHHQKTAKYCLKLQKDSGLDVKDLFKCIYCQKSLSQKIDLERHLLSCQVKKEANITYQYEKIISDLKTQLSNQKYEYEERILEHKKTIKELQDKLENIAIKAVSRPVSTTKNTQINYIQQLQPVTEEHLVSNAANLTIDHIIKGPEGYAEYALEYPLKDRMICSDYSRRKVKFKDKDGNVITDPEMTTLTKKFFESIHEKNKELICKYANELKERLGDENVMDTVVKIFDYKEAVNRACDGEKTDFHHDFVKRMCSQTIKE